MNVFSKVIPVAGLLAVLFPVTASAQDIVLNPQLTQEQFEQFTEEIGSALRFRQLGDPAPLGRGHADISVQFATTSFDSSKGVSMAFPKVVARFGLSDRVGIGAWGGVNAGSNYGLAGFETTVGLMSQDQGRPVSLSIRPNFTALIGPSDVWAANAGIDLVVSRAVGPFSPYAGVATTASGAADRLSRRDLEPATTEASLAYAGLSYRWRVFTAAAEVEKGVEVSYAFRVGTRF
jgi:hypothetical protein